MKKALLYITSIIILSGLFSCNKDERIGLNNVSTDEAAEIIAAPLSSGNGGTTAQFEDAAELSEIIYEPSKDNKEESFDTTFTVSNRDGARITFEYIFHYEYGITYNTDLGMFEFYANFDTDGMLESSRIKIIDNSDGSLNLTGMEQSEDFYSITGTVSRTGTQTTNVNDKKTITSTLDLSFNDILINKSDYKIESGSGQITIKGKTSEGNDFTFTGTLVYKSDGTIVLTINGEEYIIEIESGEISEQV